jgi:hypothetical protein
MMVSDAVEVAAGMMLYVTVVYKLLLVLTLWKVMQKPAVLELSTHNCLKSEILVIPVISSSGVYPLNIANMNVGENVMVICYEGNQGQT